MSCKLRSEFVSHKKRVVSLYKRALRLAEAWFSDRHWYRYECAIIRHRFDNCQNLTNKDAIESVVQMGENEVFNKQHFSPWKFQQSPGGTDYAREVIPPDWVLDYWHPLEKAQYPEYFARREKRKIEYVKFWEQMYRNQSSGCN